MNMASFFRKKTPILPKFIINRNGIAELTFTIDCLLPVAHLRELLTERLSDLSENDQFIHSNGAPIHIIDEQQTIISELVLDNSNVIFLKTKSTKLQSTILQNQQQISTTTDAVSQLVPSVDTITVKRKSGTESIPLSDMLSSDKLEVDGTTLSPTDMKRIIYALKQNKQVQTLFLGSVCHDVIEILTEVLKVNQTLTHLFIFPGLNDTDCILIANALVINRSLQSLNLRQNEITSVGCKAIGEMLKSNETLTELIICRNKLGDEGIKFICEALMMNRTLSRLDIYQTMMSTNGCALVAQMLRMNRTLTWIDIGDNNLSDNDIIAIADALKSNNTLIGLHVKHNEISETGALALVDTLKTNRTLETIKLQFNSMPREVQVAIQQKAPQLQLQTTTWDRCTIA